MIDLMSDEKVIKMVSTTKYEIALIQDVYGYFVAMLHNGTAEYGTPVKNYHTAAVIFEEMLQELEGH